MREIVIKDLKMIWKEKMFVGIAFLIIFIASFSSLITYGILALYSPHTLNLADSRIGFVGNAPILEKIINGHKYENLERAFEDFNNGEIHAIVYLPHENVSGKNFVIIYLPKNEIISIKIVSILRDKMLRYEEELRNMNNIPNFKLKFYDLNNKKIKIPNNFSIVFKFIYVVLIPLLSITTAIISAGTLIDSLTEEIESGSLEVLLSTQLTPLNILLGKIICSAIIFISLSIFWIFMLEINDIVIMNKIILLILISSIFALMLSLALFSSTHFMDRERSQLFYSLISVGFVTLSFSDKLMPAGLLTRVSSNSIFSFIEITTYVTISTILLMISIQNSSKKLHYLK